MPPQFKTYRVLRNRHVMTLAAALVPRRSARLTRVQERLFEVEAGTQMLARCHWQAAPGECPTLVLVHGLEGSSESRYMLTAAEKAFAAGYNVLRVNQRTCGGTERLTSTLYNSGLSGDYRAILSELIERDKLPAIFFAGYSMGGNLVFKMAGDLGATAPAQLLGICGLCPTLDLAGCVDTLNAPENAIYRWHFVRSLKARMRRKAGLLPGHYQLDGMDRVRTVREFDDVITAPHCGYGNAVNYYERASAIRVAHNISVPALILTARDDPFVPVASFGVPAISGNPHIRLVVTEWGGHCGFISRKNGDERYWAEARMIEFCNVHAAAAGFGGTTSLAHGQVEKPR